MRIKWCLLALNIIISAQVLSQTKRIENQVEVQGARISILGSTNISSFECGFIESRKGDSIRVSSSWNDLQIQFNDLRFQFPVMKFNCGFDLMTQDFRQILKASEYPTITLEITRINISPASIGFELLNVETEVLVTIAGVTRIYWIKDATVSNRSDRELTLYAKKALLMSDFKIEPPTRFLGTVRVNDELGIGIEVDLLVKKIKKGRG